MRHKKITMNIIIIFSIGARKQTVRSLAPQYSFILDVKQINLIEYEAVVTSKLNRIKPINQSDCAV